MSFKYTGTDPMKVVFLFSKGASSMKAVLESPERGKLYNVIGAVSNAPATEAGRGYGIADLYGIDVEYVNPRDYKTRENFYERVTHVIKDMAADVIGLSGWLKQYSIMPKEFIKKHKNRILNVHPAMLSILALLEGRRPLDIGRDRLQKTDVGFLNYDTVKKVYKGWERLYTGDDAVNMAVLFGEKEVASSIHSVTENVDGGPILVGSKKVPVDREYVERMLAINAFDRIGDYARNVIQEKTKIECDGPAFCKALELLGQGRMEVFDDHASLDGKELPYGGFQME